MNSSIVKIAEILSVAESFISTGFSDGYNFDDVNAATYFDELIENSLGSDPIFSGILIMEKDGNDYTVVDGLQRITTISLLLLALCANYKNTTKQNEDARNKIFNRYLINKNVPKLKLVGEEQELYKKLLFSLELSESEINSNLVQAYQGFLDQIKNHEISGTKLFRIISRIRFMVVLVDNSVVSSREVYQALNQKEESQMNLISDFIMQRADDEIVMTWRQLFNSFKNPQLACSFEDFIRDFLTVQNGGKIPKKNALYNNFKSYFIKMLKYKDTHAIIQNVFVYSQYYLKIMDAEFDDSEIKTKIEQLNGNNGKDAYPYLMEVLDDFESLHIDRVMFLDILDMVNNFVKSRLDNPESEILVDFATLSRELNKTLVLSDYNSDNLAEEGKLSINDMSNLLVK